MTTLRNHAAAVDAAANHYAASQAANQNLRELYRIPFMSRPTDFAARVASVHHSINHGLKSAEVAALVAIAHQLTTVPELRDRLAANAPTTSDRVRNLTREDS